MSQVAKQSFYSLNEVSGEVIVQEEIAPNKQGKVKQGGVPWKAVSKETLYKGEKVFIHCRIGLTLHVSRKAKAHKTAL